MNQVVLITGSAKGIGKAIAFELAQAGYAIVINYRSSKQEALAVQNQIQDMWRRGAPERALFFSLLFQRLSFIIH